MHEPVPAKRLRERDRDTPRNRHLFGKGPKRILSIDGGGVRGVIALTFLAQIETILRVRCKNPTLRLSDYFDLIGGTSTGAIIAAGLALGLSVEHLIDVYEKLSSKGFQKNPWLGWGGLIAPKFKERPLTESIERHVERETLGSDKLRTGLAIVAKRIDTESVWVFHNNPDGKYYGDDDTSLTHIPNKDMPLRNLIRASTAAPSYFTPQIIEVARDERGVVRGAFVDGGVSPYNNPALLLFMLATIRGYAFNWPTGADQLMVMSIGNGATGDAPAHDRVARIPAGYMAVKSLMSIMQDCNQLNQTLLQWMARCPQPLHIDGEIGDLRDDQLGGAPLLHYLRYDVVLELPWLRKLGLDYSPKKLTQIRQFDRPDLVSEWLEIGRRAAADQVKDAHFPAAFDLLAMPATLPAPLPTALVDS
jgi:patatin-like phospholipase